VRYNLVQLRRFTHDRHQTVDDYGYGGGRGWCSPEPFFEAVEPALTGPIVLLSARGRRFGHDDAVRFSVGERLTLLWALQGRGPAVADGLATEELSLGDFVLSGGEPAALCVLDAVVRVSRGARRPRVGQLQTALRGVAEPAELHPAPGVPGHGGA
jgi:tRNA (guanine37-N1)-methyltransferase